MAHTEPHSALFCDKSTMLPLCCGRKSDEERDSCERLWGRRGRRKEFGMTTILVNEQLIRLSHNCDTLLFCFPSPSQNHNTTCPDQLSFVDHRDWAVELDLSLKPFTLNKAHFWIISHPHLNSIDITPSKQKGHDSLIEQFCLQISLWVKWKLLYFCLSWGCWSARGSQLPIPEMWV